MMTTGTQELLGHTTSHAYPVTEPVTHHRQSTRNWTAFQTPILILLCISELDTISLIGIKCNRAAHQYSIFQGLKGVEHPSFDSGTLNVVQQRRQKELYD